MLSWPFFLKKNGTRRKSPLRTIREFALASSQVPAISPPIGKSFGTCLIRQAYFAVLLGVSKLDAPAIIN
jgi:hypothetical protein